MDFEDEIKTLKKKKPLYKKLEEKFERKYEMETLAEKKKRLEELRNLKQPLNSLELQDREERIKQDKLDHEEKIR